MMEKPIIIGIPSVTIKWPAYALPRFLKALRAFMAAFMSLL